MLDDLDDENMRAFAAQLFESEPDIDPDEFQDCLSQYRGSLKRWRAEHHEEQQDVFRRMLDAARRVTTHPVRRDDR